MTNLWVGLHRDFTPEMLGHIPGWLNEDDPRPAREQIDANYLHGGGWRPQSKFKRLAGLALQYPGDPPLMPLAFTVLHDELVVLYDAEYIGILQTDDRFEVARVD